MVTFVGFPQDTHSFSAAEVGRALSGLVLRESSGLPREGMMGAGARIEAVPGQWQLQINPFVYVTQDAGAIQLSGVSLAEQVNIVPAPGSVLPGQSRIDVLAWDAVNASLRVIAGTPASTPAVPSVPAPEVALARYRVNAGDGQVLAAQLTQVFQFADRVRGTIGTLGAGFTVGANTLLERDAADMIEGYVELVKGSGQIGSDEWMATLPGGFRPSHTVESTAAVSQGTGAAAAAFLQIRPNGGVYVFNPPSGVRKCSFMVRYKAAAV